MQPLTPPSSWPATVVRRARASVVLCVTIALAAAACGGSASNTSSKEGAPVKAASVTLTINGEPTTLDPQARDDGNLRAVTWNIYDRLMERTAAGQLVPSLAAAAPTQAKPNVWEFKLRTNVKFTDGEAFDASSAAFSIKRIINAKYNSELLGSVDTITDATAVSADTLDVTTKGPDPILPSRMTFIAMMAPTATNSGNIAQKPVGTGPYEFVTWAHGDHISLKANPGYWGTKPSIGNVTFSYPEESGTRLAQLLSGKTDLVTNVQPTDAKSVPNLLTAPGDNHALVILNAESGVTSDVRVRQAMNYAVDAKTLASKLFDGYATPDNCQFMSTAWFGYNPNLQPYPYDPAKAKQLIAAAGATGKTITLVADASGRWLADRDFAQAVAQYWREAGLNVKLQLLQFSQYLDKLFSQPKRPDAVMVYHDNALFDADRTVSTYYQHGGSGASNNNSQIAQLADKARTETDQAARLQDYYQISKIGCDQALFYFGLHVQDLYGASKRLSWKPRQDGDILVKDMSVS